MAEKRVPLFLGIDVGTQSARVGVCTEEGDLLSVASKPYATSFPKPGWAEQDPSDWWRSICDATKMCLRKAAIDPSRIDGISFDATSSTVLLVDRMGEPLSKAILWMDQRAHAEAEDIARTKHSILKYVGGQDSVEWMVPKALWLRKNSPEQFHRAWKLLEATDWVAFKLTGAVTASLCNATCKWNYAAIEGGWSTDFLDALGARELLSKWPEHVVAMGKNIGKLTKEAAASMGLPSGIPVAEGGIDAHVGLLGLNALSPSRMGLIVGSSNVMFVLNDSPVYSAQLWGPYPDAITEGTWLVEAGQISSGSIINWLAENFGLGTLNDSSDKEKIIGRLEEEAAAIPAGSGGLIMLDYWQGNRTPRRDPRAKGVLFGLTLGHDYRHIVRSAYEGIVFGTRHIVETLRENGVPITNAAAGGGGIRSRIWLQLTADVCCMSITIPRHADACSVVGCSIIAACGSGRYGSLREAASAMVHDERIVSPMTDPEIYQESYRKYLDLYESTKSLL
jgi:FGGY-family pentulose kinase